MGNADSKISDSSSNPMNLSRSFASKATEMRKSPASKAVKGPPSSSSSSAVKILIIQPSSTSAVQPPLSTAAKIITVQPASSSSSPSTSAIHVSSSPATTVNAFQSIPSTSKIGSEVKIKITPVSPLSNTDQDSLTSEALSLNEKRFHATHFPLLRAYSSGVTFLRRARVKRISCDQLGPLNTHKERFPPNRERRSWVVKKLYKNGGWIRRDGSKKEQDRIYVAPNTPLPQCFTTKPICKIESNEYNYFDDAI